MQSRFLCSILNALFNAFDELTERYECFKVDSIGDAYLAGESGMSWGRVCLGRSRPRRESV